MYANLKKLTFLIYIICANNVNKIPLNLKIRTRYEYVSSSITKTSYLVGYVIYHNCVDFRPKWGHQVIILQLLVKARRNEEEETTSKMISKNVTVGHESTLEQRVDNLIAKSNSNPAPPNLTKGDNNRSYGRPPFQSKSRPKRDYRQDPRCPPMDLRQNLRGPETSAASPCGEADGSRPIQCF